MKGTARHIFLESGGDPDSIILFSDRISLAEGSRRSVETLCRVVKFEDLCYGEVDISKPKLLSMIKNFDAKVYGQDIAVDIAHNSSDGAAGFIRKLHLDGNKLRGEIEWTDHGVEAVTKRGFRYFSAEYHEDWRDPETGKKHGPTLMAAALTIRPRVKKLDPIDPDKLQLSFDDDERGRAVSPSFKKLLTEEITAMWAKMIEELKKQLSAKKLSEGMIKLFVQNLEAALKGITEEAEAKLLMEGFVTAGDQLVKELAEKGDDDKTIKLDFSSLKLPEKAGLTKDDIVKLLAEENDRKAAESKKLQESLETKIKLFSDTVTAAEGVKQLSDETRNKLLSAKDLITAEMTEDQIKKLAENQIKLGNDISVAAQLAARGFSAPVGTVHISVDDSNNIKALQESIDKRLGLADMSESRRFAPTGGKLQEENKKLAEIVLARFDKERVVQLQAEHKMLAGGDGIVSDVNVPVVWERTVIREALYRLVGLQFVDSGSLDFATSYSIPYSYRDTAAAGRNSTRKYEGQAIARAGVIQTADTAYNVPQKLAFEISDELRYLTQARHLNWDAVTENQQNASRIIGEDLEQLLFNEVQHASDEYGAVAVVNEDLELQADGTDEIFILAQFPVVRPRKIYDLQGNQVGSTVNQITVTYDSVARSEYDGTGEQAAGIYYVLDYQLGEIYLVDEAGAVQTPVDTTAYTISYSYAANVYKFDTDIPAETVIDAHWDTFLYRYGLRKSVIEDERWHTANFGLMSGTAMTQIEQAKQFGANSKRAGTDLMVDGNLGRVKDIPNFKTSAPALWMGDQRVIVGERGVTRFRMTKPWQLGQLENQKDSNGRFTGKKEAYGDQFIVLHTPTPLKRAYTSILLYGAAARVARPA